MNTCDILVIGGGIAGIGAAAMASRDARVTVLETEGAFGYHATGRSAAAFALNYGHATLRALTAASLDRLQRPGDLADAPLLTPRGELQIATEAQAPAPPSPASFPSPSPPSSSSTSPSSSDRRRFTSSSESLSVST